MGNPFAITSDDLLKKQQGVSGTKGADAPKNTKETREAKEKEQLGHTNVLNQTNGGSMVTTDGRFENYDGFTRISTNAAQTRTSSTDGECEAATADAKNAQSDASSAKSKANDAADVAENDN